MDKKKMYGRMALVIALLGATVSHAAEYRWTNSRGDDDFNQPANWNEAPVGGNNYVIVGTAAAGKATLSSGTTPNFAGLRIGYSEGDGELVQTGGTLNAHSVGHGASRLGGNKHSGTYRMTGGTATINALQLGMGHSQSQGRVILSGGDLTVSGAVAHYSLRLGDSDRRAKGLFEISGGSLQTRTDVLISSYGTFAVLGNNASDIRIGSYASGDGAWFQQTGGTLKCRIATSGITPIFIDDTQDPLDGDGNVLFCDGALLDVGFLDAKQKGEWDVMHWEGMLVDYGLKLAPTVDASIWSFSFVDTDGSGSPDTLRVKAGEKTPVAVESESSLKLDVMFDDFMVLQRDMNVPVWGTAPAGSAVALNLDGQPVATATADARGNWLARIGAHAGDGGVVHTLTVSTPGENALVLNDVVFGDVYICSGQSNMDRTLTGLMLGEDIVQANHPLIRQIKMAHRKSSKEESDPVVEYTWSRCHSSIAGEFTATGYFTAKAIQAVTGEPVGLLYAAWGGRPIREFIAPEGIDAVPSLGGVSMDIDDRVLTYYFSNYNAMIAPMSPYGVRGALWYQGEADAGRMGADLYRLHMAALVRGWRVKWNQERFSFYFVQLPNYTTKADWARFREAQERFLEEPDTGMAVTIDIGNNRDVHPTNKEDVGNRLAAWALAQDLGCDLVYSSPLFREATVEGSRMRVHFDHAEGGLISAVKNGREPPAETDAALQNFELAGADKVFHKADATIDGETVLVSSPGVSKPVYVRYCYHNTPDAPNKLYNRAGFPAAPFRNFTDYELKVSGGEGSARSVEVGRVLTITAGPAKEGLVFDRWIGGGKAVADPKAASTKVTMPDQDLYLVAAYRSI
ncbi:sialate O-acetylesterase [Pontiellaceae bacterium B12219]|nr:sialate O-acetylesterase [Pontiellaceae bacterium B12219]